MNRPGLLPTLAKGVLVELALASFAVALIVTLASMALGQ
jgi:hypothetical protein